MEKWFVPDVVARTSKRIHMDGFHGIALIVVGIFLTIAPNVMRGWGM